MPSTMRALFRSVKRRSSLPTLSYLPDSSQSEAGQSHREQTPPVRRLSSISSRIICSILLGYAAQGHILRIDAVGNVFHIAAAQHQRVAVDNAVGGLLFESFADKLVKFHLSFHPFKKISPGLKSLGQTIKSAVPPKFGQILSALKATKTVFSDNAGMRQRI